ncbi:tetratricopeptide repeat protein [bacterium]|nr:tetratricopeptide repeat protein [bacterium]
MKYYKLIFLFITLTIAEKGICAEIVDIQLGKQKDYTLLVITADRDLDYRIQEDDGVIFIRFPDGTAMVAGKQSMDKFTGGFFQSARYDQQSSSLIIQTSANYHLTVYENRRPFQLVLDFAHRPGGIVKSRQPEKPPIKEEPVTADTGEAADSYEMGLILKTQGKYPEAVHAFESALSGYGLRAQYQLALVYDEMNQRAQAAAYLEQIVQDSAEWLEPKCKLALIYQVTGGLDKAEEIWSDIVQRSQIDTSGQVSAEQLALLENLLAQYKDSGFPQAPSTRKFPDFPWFVYLILGILIGLISFKLYIKFRGDKLIKDTLGDDIFDEEPRLETGPPEPAEPGVEWPVKSREAEAELLKSLIDEGRGKKVAPADDLKDELEDLDDGEVITDESKEQIFKLADQNLSASEIARTLGLGQEEVKFILDFRGKMEDNSGWGR